MSLLNSVTEAVDAKIDELSKMVEAEQAEAKRQMAAAENEKAKADIQSDVKAKIEDLQGRINHAKKQLAEAKDAGESSLKEMRESLTGS